ncbi:EamA family transporter [Catenuloplanes atrovinosus]|uniref:Inner membrane transporter RhtA n=1 Tax=Catenuloplanes atrovinosus TaxID=137266 RepID=A0AAE3YTI4_9ACTN|nr:EamA family transporter [Catenuloplanes atrovinosus]MDR7278094.1 inner membrane transporter RhtA [Catenuloplanes atrovinosus]
MTTDVLASETPTAPTSPARQRRGGRRGDLGAVGLVLAAAVSVQFGSGVAALLFPQAGAAGMVALRLSVAAVLMLALCRPRLRGRSRADWLAVAGLGLAFAGMNSVFYQAIDRIPLGPAVTLEVLGPLTLSIVTARRRGTWLWALVALAGVALLGTGGIDRLNAPGVALALVAGALWAAYILLSASVGRRFTGADGLALALGVAALLTLPVGIFSAGSALLDPVVLVLGAGVALLSSVLPYTFEMTALRRLPSSTFAIMMSLGPALACLAGFVVLGQPLNWLEGSAVLLVITASAGAVHTGTATPPPTITATPTARRRWRRGRAG